LPTALSLTIRVVCLSVCLYQLVLLDEEKGWQGSQQLKKELYYPYVDSELLKTHIPRHRPIHTEKKMNLNANESKRQ